MGSALLLESVPNLGVLQRAANEEGFRGLIDWPTIEASDQSIEQTHSIEVTPIPVPEGADRFGTVLTIDRLHADWGMRQLNRFLAEVRSTRPDVSLIAPIDEDIFPGEHLLPSIQIADSLSPDDPGFTIELSGEFEGSESQWPTLLTQLGWMLEIDAREHSVHYRITPSKRTADGNEAARQRSFEWPRSRRGPEFSARIFIRDGTNRKPLSDVLARFSDEAAGIRVYSEGFRVLPYGSARNDWLGIDADYGRRSALQIDEADLPRPVGDERVYLLRNQAYFGGVFLLDSRSLGLEMVVNREGFLPNAAYEEVVDLVRRGVALSVRTRAAAAVAAKSVAAAEEERRAQTERDSILDEIVQPNEIASSVVKRPDDEGPNDRADRWIQVGKIAASAIRSKSTTADAIIDGNLRLLTAAIDEVSSAVASSRDEQAQLRVLAGIGTQMSAFVHEVNGVLGQSRVVLELLDQLIDTGDAPVSRLREIRRLQNELVAALERQAVYLADSLDAEARRRRSPQSIHARVETAFRLLSSAAVARNVELVNDAERSARTRPMFPAELNVILTNLLSNAIKAAAAKPGVGRRVRVETNETKRAVTIRVSNTGLAVDLSESERWFRPFETTTSEVDSVLGQGLGMGLPLTRRMVEEYGGTLRFVEPNFGMDTAIEAVIPAR